MNKGKIAIEGMKIFAHHGYYPEERAVGKEFIVDVYVDLDFKDTLQSDHIRDTINYEEVIEICQEEMKQPSKLLEHVAMRMVERISLLSPKQMHIKVRIQKPHPLLKIPMEKFYVEYESWP
ncbi:MAG: dihydroneopterin aldolase [Saprospiraceae bacterium]|nr:dihydroneopterin aldolase [Saprospiraceae bacterium]